MIRSKNQKNLRVESCNVLDAIIPTCELALGPPDEIPFEKMSLLALLAIPCLLFEYSSRRVMMAVRL